MKYSHYLTVSETTDLGETFAIKLNENVKQVETYLMHTFFSYLNEHEINDVFNYLDYHYSHYTQRNPGKELSFLYFVNECTRGNGMVETLNGKTMKMYTPIFESRGETVREWVEAKKKELNPPVTMNLDTGNTPPNQSRNKTYITHPQQILLFHELGIIKFLKDKYKLGNEKTAEIISYLANRGKDNTGDYIRYIDQPKDSMAKSKRNVNPKTPANIEFVKQIMNQINLPV